MDVWAMARMTWDSAALVLDDAGTMVREAPSSSPRLRERSRGWDHEAGVVPQFRHSFRGALHQGRTPRRVTLQGRGVTLPCPIIVSQPENE